MATSVIELLKACNAWVDPNLLALIEETKVPARSMARNHSDEKKRKHNVADKVDKTGNAQDVDDADDDQFAYLGRSVLKRASHVSDAEDSEHDESS